MTPKYQLIYKDCCVSKSKRDSLEERTEQSSSPERGLLPDCNLPAWAGSTADQWSPSHRPPQSTLPLTISISKPSVPPSWASPSVLPCFLQLHPALTLNFPLYCPIPLHWPPHHSQLHLKSVISTLLKMDSPLGSLSPPHGGQPSLPSFLSWPLHWSPVILFHSSSYCFVQILLPKEYICSPIAFALSLHPTVRPTDNRPNLRC